MSFIEEANSLKSKLGLTRPNKTLVVIFAVLTIVAAALVAGFVWDAFTAPDLVISNESSKAIDAAADEEVTEPETIFVHVTGAVVNPGLYELESDARVSNAIQAAGGFNDEALESSVNLARTLTDGEQILVASHTSETDSSVSGDTIGAESATAIVGGKVNINLAGAEDLMTLNGVGEATAEKILAYRDQHGSFSTIEEIKEVSGIGDKKFENIKDSITV